MQHCVRTTSNKSRYTVSDKTAEVLQSMFCEDTGRSFMDSGGYPQYDAEGRYCGSTCGYGRAYERNRGRDLRQAPEAYVRFRKLRGKLEVEYGKSAFHHCLNTLEFHQGMDDLYQEFTARSSDPYLQDALAFTEQDTLYRYLLWKCGLLVLPESVVPAYRSHETYAEHEDSILEELLRELRAENIIALESTLSIDEVRKASEKLPGFQQEVLEDLWHAGGTFGGSEYSEEPLCEYTYNTENNLSQDLQYVLFSTSTNEYVLLQSHNGCDARGGFSKPRVFECADAAPFLADARTGYLVREGADEDDFETQWYTDDGGYHWYGARDNADLRNMTPVIDLDDDLENQDIELADDQLPIWQKIVDIDKALCKAPRDLAEACERNPRYVEHYMATVQTEKARLWAEQETLLGELFPGALLLRDDRAFINGIEITAQP